MHKTKKATIKLSDRAAEFIVTRKTGELASLTGREVAEALGVDFSPMAEAFEADQHIDVDRFITREKMHRSLFILDTDREITIDELSQKMGFRETHRFAGEFEEYLSIHPRRYKEIIHP